MAANPKAITVTLRVNGLGPIDALNNGALAPGEVYVVTPSHEAKPQKDGRWLVTSTLEPSLGPTKAELIRPLYQALDELADAIDAVPMYAEEVVDLARKVCIASGRNVDA